MEKNVGDDRVGNELLHYENVCFRRDGRHILDNVNWHIEEGEHWAILGLNGAGKSTLLSMIPAYQFQRQAPCVSLVMNLGNMHGLKSNRD